MTLHYLTERPALAAWLEPAERSWLEAALAAEQRTSSERSEVTLLGMLSNRVVWVLASITFLGNTGAYGITFWLPQVLAAETARSSFVVGVLTVIPQLVVVGAVLAVSTHSDRTGERCLHAGIPFLVAGLGLMIAAPAYSLPVTLLGMSLGLAGYGAGSYGPFWSLPCSFLRGAAAAAGIAFINSVGNLGGLVGPYLLGAVKDRTGGYSAGLVALGRACWRRGHGDLIAALGDVQSSIAVPGERRHSPTSRGLVQRNRSSSSWSRRRRAAGFSLS